MTAHKPTLRFTDRSIKALRPASRDAERYDIAEASGLALRVSWTGTKTWVFRYRFDDRMRRMTLGTYPSLTLAGARKAHGEALAKLEEKRDPGAERVQRNQERREEPTVAELAAEYIERHARPKKRSWRTDERILNVNVLPFIGRRKVSSVGGKDINALIDRVNDRGAPIGANRTLAVVRRMFNFGIERFWLGASPCAGVKPPGKEQQRDRVLREDEIRTLWHALDHGVSDGAALSMEEGTRLALLLILATAQRKGEVIGARWDQIDLERHVWHIPAELAKNSRPHSVPLSALAVSLLERARALAGDSAFVFPGRRRRLDVVKADHPLTGEALNHAAQRARNATDVAHFTPHDLRRTAATLISEAGVSRLVLGKILNHVDGSVTAVYDRHTYDAEKHQALDALARRLESIVTGEPTSAVVPFRTA